MVALRHTSRKADKLAGLKFARREAERLRCNNPIHRFLRNRLAAVTSFDDPAVLDQLIRLGVRPESVRAFRYLPVAEVAWASGSVTSRERMLAMRPLFTKEVFGCSEAVKLFKSWLTTRPQASFMAAWEEFVALRLQSDADGSEAAFGKDMLGLATRVALASGGLFDQGEICAGERLVLDRIAKVYGIETAS